MADKNRINHTKHLMKINSLSNPKQENKTITLQSKTFNTSPQTTKMDSNHTLNLTDIDDNTPSNERSLSATLKNIVTIPPLQGPSVYPSIVNSTNINNNILSKPTQNETNPDKSQPQFFVPNNNAINKNIPNVLKVPSTGKLNTTLPYIGAAQLPILTTSHNETLQCCVPVGMVNMPQLPLQQPVMLSTPPILQLHSPMYISSSSSLSPPLPSQPQPVVTYNQKLPQHSQCISSMTVPIQSSVLQPFQGDHEVSTPWKIQKDMSPSIGSKNNEKIGINIPPINKLSINRADSLPSKILNDMKGDQVQPLGKRDSVTLERDNDTSPVSKVPLFINAATAAAATTSTSTIINKGSTTDITQEKPGNTQNGNGYENELSIVKETTTTATLDSSNSIGKEDTEGKAGNPNKIKNSLDDEFNETDNNDTVYSNKKSCRKVRDSKRALQNRNAQKAFRQRKEKYVKLLELKARKYDEVMQENFTLKKEILNLKNVILQMEQQIRIYNGYYSNYLQQQQPQQLVQTQQLPHLPQLPLQFQSPPPQPPPAPPK